ncbi:MAG: ABC transporter substrate-binding protein [Mesorhizobium sp.]|nr:MAG: ABC transporter substrate-binding protein [Mesorhizobium sp.]
MAGTRVFLLLTGLVLAASPVWASKTLVYCTEASPDTFDPALASGTRDASATTLYNRIVEFEPGSTKVRPGLAEDWTISDDGLRYTFHLRHGVKFHSIDGFSPSRDFNADDVLFTFDRQANAENPFHNYAGRQYTYFDGMGMPRLVDNWRKIDDYTVVLTLKAPHAPMLANLAMDFASVVSKEYADRLIAEKRPLDLATKPVGTGPFQLADYQQDAVIRYKANPDYWRGRAKIDDLVFAITTDPAVRAQKLKAGECNIMSYPAPADIAGLQADANLTVAEQEGLNVGALMYNTQQKPFDDVRVRKALNMAINKKAIIDAVFQGAGQVAINPIPPTMWSYNKNVKDDPYDPDAAKKLLEEAGVKDLKMNVWAMPVSRPYMPNARRTAELIQADFAKVGVTVNIVSYDWGEYLKRASAVDHDGAVIVGWTGDNGDPDNFLGVLLSCASVGSNNRAEWCNKDFDALINKAKTVSDQAERTKLYEQAQVIFKEQAPWATLAHSKVFMPMQKTVSGFAMDPLGIHRFDGVDIAE